MSKSYGQFCPVATAAEVFCERWNALIIRELVSGSETFNDIRMGGHAGFPLAVVQPPESSRTRRRYRQGETGGQGEISTHPGRPGVEATYHGTRHLGPALGAQ